MTSDNQTPKSDNELIVGAVLLLSDAQKADREKCLKDGLKDEVCKKCGRLFLAHVHFVRCYLKPCPISNGVSVLDMMLNEIDNQPKP